MHGSKWYWVVLVFVKIGDMYKFITGGKNVSKSEQSSDLNDQNVDDSDFDECVGDDGVVGLIPDTLSDSDIGGKEGDSTSREAILRDVTRRAKRAHRGKRRR